jgi:hypothetical protein
VSEEDREAVQLLYSVQLQEYLAVARQAAGAEVAGQLMFLQLDESGEKAGTEKDIPFKEGVCVRWETRLKIGWKRAEQVSGGDDSTENLTWNTNILMEWLTGIPIEYKTQIPAPRVLCQITRARRAIHIQYG